MSNAKSRADPIKALALGVRLHLWLARCFLTKCVELLD
jgi:hypothetical protein